MSPTNGTMKKSYILDKSSYPIKGGIYSGNHLDEAGNDPQLAKNLDIIDENNDKAEEDHLFKRAGAYIEYGNEVQADMKSSKALQFKDPPLFEETDDEDNVYPLSIKYNRKKA